MSSENPMESSYTFTHAIVRIPGTNFAEGLTSVDFGIPDYPTVRLQHSAYIAALKTACGLQVTVLPADDSYPDGTFVEDTAIVTPHFAVMTRPGAASRAGEVSAMEDTIRAHFQTVYSITEPGTLDGGDICDAGDTFFIGISHRTNEEGAHQLASILESNGYRAVMVDIRGMKNILHLKSGIAYIGDQRLVMWQDFAEMACFNDYEKIITLPEENYAANCIRINEHILIPADYDHLADQLETRGYSLIPLVMEEFQKMDGGLSCLSLRFFKEP
ncbi:MAG: N(G),N(G)-dimethylarginine dimethylaminohydrolase [Anaerolineae bacterium]|nr:N(G),N(G)-dimethylarginine dimethylaminohydrolase [Anaerolineae bacterium]